MMSLAVQIFIKDAYNAIRNPFYNTINISKVHEALENNLWINFFEKVIIKKNA